MSFFWIKRPEVIEEPQKHILVLHSRCQRSYRDFYLADLILALLRNDKKVTLCTTEMNMNSPLMNVEDENDDLYFINTWRFLPKTLFGYFAKCFLQLKLMWLVFRMIVRPPSPPPQLIITDVNTTIIWMLKTMSSYKVIYLKHFSDLHSGDHFYEPSAIMPSGVLQSMTHADEIIVQTECLRRMLKRSLPIIENMLSVLNPCYDTGLWMFDTLDMKDVVPNLPKENFLFVAFGEFKPRTNLCLLLRALAYIVLHSEVTVSVKVHLVIAGYSEPLSYDENTFFDKLLETVKNKPYSNNITFLKRTSVFEQKTLIKNCTAVLNPTNFNVFPGPILMAMNMNKPIISVKNGFAQQVLIDNHSGFFSFNIPSIFAERMMEIIQVPQLAMSAARNAKREFDEKYSFQAYSRQLNEIVDNYL